MGDGGVTLVPFQHVVEKVFSMRKNEVRSEKGQSLEERPRGKEPERRRKCEPESVPKKRCNGGVVELGEVVPERLTRRSDAESRRNNGEFVPWRPGKPEPNSDRWGKLEVEKKEKCDGWGKWQGEKKGGEMDKSHYSRSERSRKDELEKRELVPENNSSYLNKVEVERRGGDGEKSEFCGSGRRQRMELEEEEFIPENSCRKKDGDRGSGIDNRKNSFRRISSSLNCDSKKSSRAHEEEQDEFKHEASSGKVQDKDHFFERPAKRRCGEPESNGRKYHHQEISDISQLKSRRKSEENILSRVSYPERSNKNRPILPSKVSSSNRHPSCRHHEPFLSLLEPDKQDQRDHKDRTPSHYDRSPVERIRHHYNRDHPNHKDRTLSHSDRSTVEKVRHYDNRDHRDHRDRTPSHSDQSPTERVRHRGNRNHYDHRDRTPSLSDRSSTGRARRHDHKGHSDYMDCIPSHSNRKRALRHGQSDHPDHRDHTPCPMERARHYDHKERSPHDRRRAVDHRIRTPNGRGRGLDSRERNKKSGEGEKQLVDRQERLGRRGSSGRDGSKISSLRHTNNRGGDTCFDDKPSKKPLSPDSLKEFGELPSPPPPPLPPPRPLPSSLIPPQPEADNVLDELPCMEEGMDVCDTPPHDTIPVDSKPGKWFYLDHFGMKQGPCKLDDLKRLINTGILLSDHLIKHSDNDQWVTVENAASPLMQLNLTSIVSDSVTEMTRPPEAPGKSLVDTGDLSLDSSTLVLQEELELGDEPAALEFSQDFLIDERVEGLLKGYDVVNGKELETLGEALNMTFEHADWESWSCSEGFTRFQSRNFESLSCRRQELRSREGFPREAIEARPVAHLEKDFAIPNTSSSDWFSARWSCMGGDWKRNDESGQDRFCKKKIILNHCYPLCQMPKSAYEDPRWQQRDDLYYPSRIRKLEVPAWAFSFSEEDSDINNDTGKVTILRQMKPPNPKGVKGTILPVVQTNACVVKDQGSSASRLRFKGSERHTRRSTRPHSAYGDRCSDSEEPSKSKKTRELDLKRHQRCLTALNIPRDHVCTVDELSLDLGDWYYMDGAGHVHGTSSFSELQDVVAKGTIMQNSSVFRKVDNTWLPVLAPKASSSVKERDDLPAESSYTSNDLKSASDSFHDLHPQFIGYTRGKLHELVMKSYKNREFAAAINEVLDPWISAKQQKKIMDKHFSFNSSTTKREDAIPEMFRDGSRFGKSACLLSDGDYEMKEDLHLGPKNDPSFDDLCGEADFIDDNIRSSGPENKSWGLLNIRILARVFHCMKTDLKSLISSAATCKSWNLAVNVYKNLCTFVDMSSVGPRCTDSMFRSAMGGYEKKKLTSIVLAGCSNITSAVLEEVLSLFPAYP